MHSERSTTSSTVLHILVYVAFYFACYHLFYLQATGEVHSDLATHLRLSLDTNYTHYSLVAMMLASSFGLAGYQGVAASLALVMPLTLGLTEYLLWKLIPGIKPLPLLVLAVLLNLAIAIFVPFLNEYLYRGTSSGNKWHNPTYSCMRLFALLAIIFYLQIIGRINSRANLLSYALFFASVFLATAIKPSFYTVFAPAVFFMCVIDLIRDKRTLKRSLLLGLMLLVPLIVVASQYEILFGESKSGGGVGIGLALVWGHYSSNVPAAMLQSYAFPILVLIACWPTLKHDSNYSLAWIMFLIGLAEYLFLYETGPRMWHGNFGWGSAFGVYYLMIASTVALINSYRHAFKNWILNETKAKSANYGKCVQPLSANAYAYMASLVLAYHALSGLALFIAMEMGGHYNNIGWPL